MGSAAGVGEGAVFAGAVVLGLVAADELRADRDLDGVADDSDLDLTTSIGGADAVVRTGEGHVSGRVDLAGHRRRRHRRPRWSRLAAALDAGGLLVDRVPAG